MHSFKIRFPPPLRSLAHGLLCVARPRVVGHAERELTPLRRYSLDGHTYTAYDQDSSQRYTSRAMYAAT